MKTAKVYHTMSKTDSDGPSVKIVLLGDPGVGKTSLVHTIAHEKSSVSLPSTVGCSVEVKVVEVEEGDDSSAYFVELWDVGGSAGYEESRKIFYENADGIILVHDLSNNKSYNNLRSWYEEILPRYNGEGDADCEGLFGSKMTPTLIIGTKKDLVSKVPTSCVLSRDYNASTVYVNSQEGLTKSSEIAITSFLRDVISRGGNKVHLSDMSTNGGRRRVQAYR
eukprot:m.18083 g.18083  ORF g.18083 m.18083 type:complete len:222 (-) comp6195_c0_seq1:515-1180(-)